MNKKRVFYVCVTLAQDEWNHFAGTYLISLISFLCLVYFPLAFIYLTPQAVSAR